MKNKIALIIFSTSLLTGAAVCAICDLAISQTLTWSLIPISSIIFAWIILFPMLGFQKNSIYGSLVALSIFAIPYLYILNSLIETHDLIFIIGSSTALIGIIYLWCIFILAKIFKSKYKILGFSLLLAIPFCILINYILHQVISEPIIDPWDILTFTLLIILSCTFLGFDKQSTKVNAVNNHKN